MSKHTPGPWRIDANACRVLATPKGWKRSKGHPVFVVAQCFTYCSASLDETHANAYLIAAAPEMLASLQSLLASMRAGEIDEADEAMVARARAAIAKAEGKVTA